jgi:hypothetical protein
MHLGLRQRHRYAQHAAVTGLGDAHRHQHGAINDLPGLAHSLVARIKQHIGCHAQRPRAPRCQPLVEPFGGAADLGRGDRHFRADQPPQHFDHLARGHALHIHLSQRQIQRLLCARALLQRARIKTALTGLRHGNGELTHTGQHGLRLEAVGMVAPLGCALERLGAKILGSLDLGGFVDQNAQRLAGAVQSLRQKSGVRRFERIAINVLRHRYWTFEFSNR